MRIQGVKKTLDVVWESYVCVVWRTVCFDEYSKGIFMTKLRILYISVSIVLPTPSSPSEKESGILYRTELSL
jgi:hypothetical protein